MREIRIYDERVDGRVATCPAVTGVRAFEIKNSPAMGRAGANIEYFFTGVGWYCFRLLPAADQRHWWRKSAEFFPLIHRQVLLDV